MPSIASSDDDCIDILSIQQLAKVSIQFAIGVSVMLVDKRLASISATGLDVRDCDALYIV